MATLLNIIVEVGMFVALIGMLYCIVQVVDVIREERERLMWYRQTKAPVLNDKDDYNEPPKE